MRTELPPRRLTLEEFCALATERARLLDPAFPPLTTEGVVEEGQWFCVYQRTKEALVDGRGWRLLAEERHVGPAEVIQEDAWVATARGDGWILRVRYDTSGGVDRLWEEREG